MNIHQDCVSVAYSQVGDIKNQASVVVADYMELDAKDFENEVIIGLYYFDTGFGYDAIVVSYNEVEPCYNIHITFVADHDQERMDIVKSCPTYNDTLTFLENKLDYDESGLYFDNDVNIWLKRMQERVNIV